MLEQRYPPDDRSGLWSWDVVKLVIRHRIAKRLGSAPAALIITAVAAGEHREDYLVPPAFWNKELMDAAGLEDEKAFIRARTRAVDSGWLAYRKGRIREAGQYWVTLPDWAAKGMRVQKASHAPVMRQSSASHPPVITTPMRQSSPPSFSPSSLSLSGEGAHTPTPTGNSDKKPDNTDQLKRALRRHGLGSGREAVREWADLLQGACGCQTVLECIWATDWLMTTASADGKPITYARHAGPYATRCRRAVRDLRHKTASTTPTGHDADTTTTDTP